MHYWDDGFIYYMFVDEHLTIREVAKRLGVSKSGLHHHIHSPSFGINAGLSWCHIDYLKDYLKHNFNNKHIKGGAQTKKMYARLRKEKGVN